MSEHQLTLLSIQRITRNVLIREIVFACVSLKSDLEMNQSDFHQMH